MTRTILVVGGGITGLVAARRLSEQTDAEIIVCESSPRLGGKLNGVALDDLGDLDQQLALQDPEQGGGPQRNPLDTEFTVDAGAESLLARRPEGLQLITELGLDDQRVHPTASRAQAFLAGQIRSLPPSNLGVPTDLDALRGYLTDAGLDRARTEVDLDAPPLTGDVEIGRYVATRFGDEVTDRVLEPMLGGVYAGQSRRLSFQAVHPALFTEASRGGSLLAAAQRVAAAAKRSNDHGTGDEGVAPPVFAGLIGGVNRLIGALVADLERRGVKILTRATVRSLTRKSGRYEVITGPVPQPKLIMADRVLLAIPAAPTARLLTGLSPAAAAGLAEIPYASMAVITFVLAGAELQGSGLLVPPGELPTIKAFTYSSNKWDWIRERAEADFGPGTAVVRASVGRFGEEQLLQVDDQQLARRTLAEARGFVPGFQSVRPLRVRVQRWGGGLPQYLLDHRRRIADIRTAVAELDGIAIAGAYTDGVGLPACMASATAAADTLL
ncbi:protoporphyrinogen oxidase [Microlunatus elymi]|uniref:Coproporphyrinogen III oxidase n=1 Tax=Microlunatus elymi TaxID=2596828 RepID=A0A516Q0A0_9ACTN|nr:protoporphyrinogen oxidase [Microlunatus elymi]QDP96641.1 protoporphyrinogen oxidase [Microlunatus elymi]